jgi:hypothetical protein
MYSHGCSHSENRTQHDLVRVVVPFRADINKLQCGAKFSVPMSLQCQPSWEICVYSRLAFTALLPKNHDLHAFTSHDIHFLVGGNHSFTKLCIHPQMFCDVEFCLVDIVVIIPP